MTNVEISRNNMYKKVKTFFNNNHSLFTGFTRLQTQIDQFNHLNTSLDSYVKVQGKVTSGLAESKSAALATLAANTVKVSRKLLVYAKDKNNFTLAAVLDVRDYGFRDTAYTNALQRVENILDAVKNITDDITEYRVSAADITVIETGLTACKALQGEPGNARSSKQAATKGIKSVMADIDACLLLLDDLIENEYADTYPAEVAQYRKNRRIDHIAVRHSGINAIISNGTLAEGITMTIDELAKSAVSDINGIAEISPMMPGTYHVSFAGGHYIPQTLKLTVPKGKMIQVNVEMVLA